MDEDSAKSPVLYTAPDDDDGVVVLLGTRCGECQRVFFPPRIHGCPGCSAEPERLGSLEIAGTGVLRAVTVVRRSFSADPPVPYALGQVALDAGPEIVALLDAPDIEALKPGRRVIARIIDAGGGEDGESRSRCCFVPSEAR